jgi:hypothetical protein
MFENQKMKAIPSMGENPSGRFNEPTRGLTIKQEPPKMAFGAKAPTPPGPGKPNRPPLMPRVEGFDKKEWIREYKLLTKDIGMDERDRYRPLLCLKKDFQEFILECEKEEKKDSIQLRRDED